MLLSRKQDEPTITTGLLADQGNKNSFKKWLSGTNCYVYTSHFLSAWGDRMWSFGVGLFLVSIASENLQLPALYGLASSLTIFLLGALIGDWVDNTPRLKAAQMSLVLQNVFVVICAAGVYAFLWFEIEITHGPYAEWLVPLCHALVIIMAVLSDMASMARTIAVERDWIVEICGRDTNMLTDMTSTLRRIDQVTLILAPVITGQIMTFAGLENGAIFISAWNVISVFFEYYLMWKVYNTVPALKAKKASCRADDLAKMNQEAEEPLDGGLTSTSTGYSSDAKSDPVSSEAEISDEAIRKALDPTLSQEKPEVSAPKEKVKSKKNCFTSIFSGFVTLYRGWKTYMSYSVAIAGIALACLYMTVLGFDNITVAYAVTQGVSEAILGVLMGVSAVFGIFGTYGYPYLRKRVGLVRSGIFALSAMVVCLLPCVVSIWAPGSPFDPLYYINPPQPKLCYNTTGQLATPLVALPGGNASSGPDLINVVPVTENSSVAYNLTLTLTSGQPLSVNGSNSTNSSYPWQVIECEPEGPSSIISVALLMTGIVLTRFGLWMADLTITQLFLESVVEGERGLVNGVQSSLNKLMDVLKFLLVVAVPDIPAFGYLIIISFLFICIGWVLYAIFLRKDRGHFFHKCGDSNGHVVSEAA